MSQCGQVSVGIAMAEAPYLIALAFLEQNGKRALPLAGKSWGGDTAGSEDPGEDARALTLELLLRVWQRSDEGALQRAAGGASLQLLVMPMEVMNAQLPVLKATWLAGGDTDTTLQRLQALASRSWQVSVAKYEPVTFTPQPSAATV